MSGSSPVAEEERRKRRTDTLRILNWQWDSLLDRIITSPYLERLKDRYEESGSGYFLFHALMFCASRHVLIPDWADRALHKHFGRWTAHEVRTLDEAFNLRYRKGKHLRAARLSANFLLLCTGESWNSKDKASQSIKTCSDR